MQGLPVLLFSHHRGQKLQEEPGETESVSSGLCLSFALLFLLPFQLTKAGLMAKSKINELRGTVSPQREVRGNGIFVE